MVDWPTCIADEIDNAFAGMPITCCYSFRKRFHDRSSLKRAFFFFFFFFVNFYTSFQDIYYNLKR